MSANSTDPAEIVADAAAARALADAETNRQRGVLTAALAAAGIVGEARDLMLDALAGPLPGGG